MPSHSDEIWESFDALWERISLLNRQVSELEARLRAVEGAEPLPAERDFKAGAKVSERLSEINSFEGEIHR